VSAVAILHASSGARVWAALYDGPAHGRDTGSWVAVTPDGSAVIVTGTSLGVGTADDFATVAYATAWG